VLLRDGGLADDLRRRQTSRPRVEERRAEALLSVAEQRGIRISVPYGRGWIGAGNGLASLVAVPDFTSVYLADGAPVWTRWQSPPSRS